MKHALKPLLVIVALLISGAIATYDFGKRLEHMLADLRFIAMPPFSEDPEFPILHVDIEDEAVRQIGRWPWTRLVQEKIFRTIDWYDPNLVIVDIEYPDPMPPRVLPEKVPDAMHANVDIPLGVLKDSVTSFVKDAEAGRIDQEKALIFGIDFKNRVEKLEEKSKRVVGDSTVDEDLWLSNVLSRSRTIIAYDLTGELETGSKEEALWLAIKDIPGASWKSVRARISRELAGRSVRCAFPDSRQVLNLPAGVETHSSPATVPLIRQTRLLAYTSRQSSSPTVSSSVRR